MTKKKSNNSKETPATSQSIQKQTEEYLQSGGQINVIKAGVTGVNYFKATKHITLSRDKEK